MSTSDEIRERAQIVHRDPDIDQVTEPVWTAEDPATECVGMGRIEEEAVGNLVSVVLEYEEEGAIGTPYVKLPGRTVERSWKARTSHGGGLIERLKGLF